MYSKMCVYKKVFVLYSNLVDDGGSSVGGSRKGIYGN